MGYGNDIRIPLTLVGLVTSLVGAGAYLMAMRAARLAAPSLQGALHE